MFKSHIQRARDAQRSWAQTRISGRKAIFLRYHDLILQHQEELLNLLQVEAGKSRLTAQDEVFDVVINSRHYAVRAERYLRPQRRRGLYRCLLIPWNFTSRLV